MLKGYFSYLYENTAKNSGNAVYSLLEPNKNAALLDCGCWNGVNTKKFGNIVGTNHLYGVEINKAKAKEASKKGINVEIADLNKRLPYKNNFFDVIIVYHVIEHLVNVRLFVSELHRILKNDGYVIIGTPNLASWHNIFALLLGVQPFSGPTIKPDYESDIKLVKNINRERLDKIFSGNKSKDLEHIKIMTLKALVGLLRESKLNVEEVKGFGYYPFPPPFSTLLQKFDHWHSHYVLVKSRKE